jgi:hypothetical protein
MASWRNITIDRRLGTAAAAALGLAALLATASCDGERHVTFPVSASGTICGTVSDGAPLDSSAITISVSSIGNSEPDFESRTHPDAAGNYALTVPNGPVMVSVSGSCGSSRLYYREEGLTDRSSEADTIRVDGEVYRADFACGRVTVDVGLPPELPVGSLTCGLLEPGDSLNNLSGCEYEVDGRLLAEIRLVRPGRYLATLGHGALGRVYLPATFDSTAAEVLTVVAGQNVRHTSVLPALAHLSGSVTGSWQELAVNAPRVEAWRENREVCYTEVTADGRFDLALLLGGPLRLVVMSDQIPGYIGGADFASATVFDLEPGEQVIGISYVESGLEIDIVGLSPLGVYHQIHIFDAAGRDLTRHPNGYTGFGNFSSPLQICNLPAGEVFVSLTPSNSRALWLPQFYDRQDSLAVADPITVPPDGQVGRATVTLVTGGQIHGRVLGPDGEPASSGFHLWVYPADDPNTVVSGITSFDGSFDSDTGDYDINGLRNGVYKVRGGAYGGTWIYWPGVVSFEDAGVITIENLGEVTGIDLTLP